MNSVTWIIIAVVAVLVIIALLVMLGLRRGKTKQVSFEKKEELEQKKPTSGDYEARIQFQRRYRHRARRRGTEDRGGEGPGEGAGEGAGREDG